ncbi:MAG: hypothetical protein ACQGVK_01075 [Myxococcota bacterium]
MKKTLEIDLDVTRETWDAFLRRYEQLVDEALSERDAPAAKPRRETFWENGGVQIDPTAFFARFTGLD